MANPVIDEDVDTYILTPHLFIFEDKSAQMTLKEIQESYALGEFTKNTMAIPYYWMPDSAIWAKLTLEKGNVSQEKRYLLFDFNILNEIDLYIEQPDGSFQHRHTGHWVSINDRAMHTRKITIPLTISRPTTDIYYRIYAPDTDFNLITELHTVQGLLTKEKHDTIINGLYFGVAIVMLLYNFFIFISIRDKSYLFYILFTAFYIGVMFFAEGYGLALLYTNTFGLDAYLINFLGVFSLIFANLFAREFLNLKERKPRLALVLKVFNYVILANLLIAALDFQTSNNNYFIILLLNFIFLIYSGIVSYKQYIFARYFTHAWIFFLLVLSLYSLSTAGIHIPFVSYNSMKLANAVEVTLLSFALARRIRDLQEEKRKFDLLQKELTFAGEVQTHLFPRSLPSTEQISITAHYSPSSTLSGDFYDYREDEKGNLYLFITDIAGHGYSAGLVAAMVKVAYQETAPKAKNVSEHQKEINRILATHIYQVFATALNMQIDQRNKKLYVARSGHLPLIHYSREEGSLYEIAPKGMPLGIQANYSCQTACVHYKPGDRFLAFTDGVTEEFDPFGKEFGMDRLKSIMISNRNSSAIVLQNEILTALQRWRGNDVQEDDITFIIIDMH